MNVSSIQFYEAMFTKKSVLLNPPGPHEPPRNHAFLSIAEALNNITSKDVNEHGQPVGELMRLKQQRKEKKAEFERTKHPKYQDDANQISGKLLVLEKEARMLNVMLEEDEKKNRKFSSEQRQTQKNLKRLLRQKGKNPS